MALRVLTLLVGCCACVAASDARAAPLFDDHAVVEIAIRGPFGELFDDMESHDYLSFELEADGRTLGVRIQLRGHSRRRVCDFPPLRLKLSPADTDDTSFAGQDRLKLVTHCRNYDRGEQDMLEEYLAYRILNVVSEASYRVRAVAIAYVDTSNTLSAKAAQRYGFLIESDEELAARLDATEASLPGVPGSRHDPNQAALVYVFQYLVANTDWSLVTAEHDDDCCHNIKLFERGGEIVLVPYDFDRAGLVNAQYAVPDPSLRIDRVTRRVYRGVCTDREVLRRALREIRDRRRQILSLPAEVPGLSPKNVATATGFLDRFFEKAEREDRLLRSFERRCIR